MWRGQRAEQQHSRRSFDCMLDWLLLLFGTAPCGNCLQESGFSLFSAVRVTGAVWEPAARPALENCVQILSRAVVPNNTRKRIICRMGCRIYLCNVFHYVDVQERRLCLRRPKRKWVRNPFFFQMSKMPLSRALNPSLLGTTVRTAAVLAHRPHTELNMKTDVSGRIRKTEPRPSGRIDVKQQRDINWHFNLDLKRKQLKLKLGTFLLVHVQQHRRSWWWVSAMMFSYWMTSSHELNSDDVIKTHLTRIR